MDLNGETKISDLGLAAKMKSNGLYECCGTRGYWAPDMIRYCYAKLSPFRLHV